MDFTHIETADMILTASVVIRDGKWIQRLKRLSNN